MIRMIPYLKHLWKMFALFLVLEILIGSLGILAVISLGSSTMFLGITAVVVSVAIWLNYFLATRSMSLQIKADTLQGKLDTTTRSMELYKNIAEKCVNDRDR